jgi:hypothetical protein
MFRAPLARPLPHLLFRFFILHLKYTDFLTTFAHYIAITIGEEAMKISAALFAVAALACAAGASAHHGTSITYDTNKTITISGTVTEFVWAFPHVQIFLDRKDDSGATEKWGVEMGPTPTMLRNMKANWSRTSLVPGDQVTIVCNPHKVPGATACLAKQITSNGKILPIGGGQAQAAASNQP